MQQQNKRKILLLTGANSKICEDLILDFFEYFDEIILHCRSSFKSPNLLKLLLERGKNPCVLKADLTNEKECKNMFEHISERFQRVDYLVNFCGNYYNCELLETSLELWNDMISSNATAAFLVSKYSIPLMKKNNFGRIIHLADSIADQMMSHHDIVPYHIAKHGVLLLSRTLAKTYAPFGINVNTLSPGVVLDSVNKPELDQIPIRRFASKNDIFNAIMFLLSEKANYITGQDLKVAGGYKL